MSPLEAFRRRRAFLRQLVNQNQQRTPTGGGDAPDYPPAKPPDARGGSLLLPRPRVVSPVFDAAGRDVRAEEEFQLGRRPALKSCRAVCAATGRQCQLPTDGHQVHVAGKQRFTRLAQPGQQHFAEANPIDNYAGRNSDA